MNSFACSVSPGEDPLHRKNRHVAAQFPTDPDAELVEAMRCGDQHAYVVVVSRYHDVMLRIARSFVPNEAVAEEVVQDSWLGVLNGIDSFEGRCTFKTWLFQILLNRARRTGMRERRTMPVDDLGPSIDNFTAEGRWASSPTDWFEDADERMDARPAYEQLQVMIDSLPERQRRVLLLRDVEGFSAQEVCNLLGVSEGNQRVLLHRARSRLRHLFFHPHEEEG